MMHNDTQTGELDWGFKGMDGGTVHFESLYIEDNKLIGQLKNTVNEELFVELKVHAKIGEGDVVNDKLKRTFHLYAVICSNPAQKL